jgi:hypothetical protein
MTSERLFILEGGSLIYSLSYVLTPFLCARFKARGEPSHLLQKGRPLISRRITGKVKSSEFHMMDGLRVWAETYRIAKEVGG